MIQNNRILVVDDNEAIHEDFRKILTPQKTYEDEYFFLEEELFGQVITKNVNEIENNYELDFAFTGQQAIEMVEKAYIENKPYALIFMDVRMPPGLDGIETISIIWEKYPDIEIVICSAYSDYSWEEIINKLGQNDKLLFLKKPFETIELKQMALSLIKKYNLNQKVKNYVSDLENEVNKRTKQLKAMLKELLESKDKMKQEVAIKKDIEKSLENEKNNLLLILEKIDMGVINIDNDNNVIFLNKKAENIISKPKELIIGNNISNILKIKDKNDNFVLIDNIQNDYVYKFSEKLVLLDILNINENDLNKTLFIKEINEVTKINDIIKIIDKNLNLFLERKEDKYIDEIKSICNTYLNKDNNFNYENKKLNNIKVLICENNKDISVLLKKLLTELNFESEIVSVNQIENFVKEYNFIIIDYYIITELKYDLIKKIKKINNTIKIIVSVPFENKDYYNFSNEIHCLIYKPFDIENIKKHLYL